MRKIKQLSLTAILATTLVANQGCNIAIQRAFQREGPQETETYRSGKIVPLVVSEDEIWVNIFSKEGVASVPSLFRNRICDFIA